ncbi:MAG: hypothetical protein WCT99_14190 [Bacteroidota bacterium]|jgi:hypothetical protein
MKNTVVIVIGSIVSTLIIIQVFFLAYANKPELFTGIQHPDSAAVASPPRSLENPIPETTDTLAAASDDAAAKPQMSEPAKVESQKTASSVKPVPPPVDWKSKAKLLEAMKVDEAARIITTMKDDEIKMILMNLKKKTAAKVLASLEPERAAKLLR